MGSQPLKTLFLISTIILSILLFSNGTSFTLSSSSLTKESLHIFTSNHSPINITNNNDFASYASSGTGSKSTPYILENYAFSNCGNTTTALSIANTTKYFILSNISVNKCGNGISFTNVSNGEIRNSILTNNTNDGIYVSNSSFNSFIGNTILRNFYGILLENLSTNNTIENNIIEVNFYGISFNPEFPTLFSSGSVNGTCKNNTVNYNVNGINIYDFGFNSSFNTFINNIASFNSESGIFILGSSDDEFIDNTANNNTFNGFYLNEISNITLVGNNASYNQFSDGYHFENIYFPNTIKNNEAEYNLYSGFYFSSLSINGSLTILNNTAIYNQIDGFKIQNCSDLNIINNSAYNNLQDGFYLFGLQNSNLTGNTAKFNLWSNLDNASSTGISLFNNNFPINLPLKPLFPMDFIVNQDQLNLTWQAPFSNGGANITEYKIYGANEYTPFNFSLIGTSFSLFYIDPNFSFNETFYYKISAVNSAGEGPKSTTLTVSVPFSLPSVPLNITATTYFNFSQQFNILVSWNPPLSNGGYNITEYNIYRAVNFGSYSLIGSTSNLSFYDLFVTNGTHYSYEVSAVNTLGEGPKSSNIGISYQPGFSSGTTSRPPVTILPPQSLIISTVSTQSESNNSINHLLSQAISYTIPVTVFLIMLFVVVALLFTYRFYNEYNNDPEAKKDLKFLHYLKDKFRKRKMSNNTFVSEHELDGVLEKIEEILEENK